MLDPSEELLKGRLDLLHRRGALFITLVFGPLPVGDRHVLAAGADIVFRRVHRIPQVGVAGVHKQPDPLVSGEKYLKRVKLPVDKFAAFVPRDNR